MNSPYWTKSEFKKRNQARILKEHASNLENMKVDNVNGDLDAAVPADPTDVSVGLGTAAPAEFDSGPVVLGPVVSAGNAVLRDQHSPKKCKSPS